MPHVATSASKAVDSLGLPIVEHQDDGSGPENSQSRSGVRNMRLSPSQ